MGILRKNLGARAVVGLAVLVLGLQACGGGGGGGGTASSGPSGRVAILLTDAPTPVYDEVNVWIQSIELLSDSGHALVFRSADPQGEERNLLDLAGETELFTVQAGVPAGQYDKIRLQVSRVELVRFGEPGSDPEVVVPKLPGNGKIDLNPRQPFTVAPGETLIVRLDLDAEKSLHIVANSNKVIFRPVVFVDVLHEMVPGKLVRIRGTVEQKDESSFLLCPQGVSATAFGDYDAFLKACVDVQVTDQTSLFDPDGSLMPFADLAVADAVEVVGRFTPTPLAGEVVSLATFQAFVVEVGSYLKLQGTVLAAPETQGDVGVFPFALDRGQGITGNIEVQTHLFDGTKFFNQDGTQAELGALQAGTRATVDGVLFLSTDAIPVDVLKSALVVIQASPPADADLAGIVATVDPTARRVTLRDGTCAVVSVTARLFLMAQASASGPVEISPVGFDYLAPDQEVKLYGSGSVDGCLAADTGFVLSLAP